MITAKPFEISKKLFMTAFRDVRHMLKKERAFLVDLSFYEKDLHNNLYKLWNRMCSGAFLGRIECVYINLNANGEIRASVEGIEYMIAQMVMLLQLKSCLPEPIREQAHKLNDKGEKLNAVEIVKNRCRIHPFVILINVSLDELDSVFQSPDFLKLFQDKWMALYLLRLLEQYRFELFCGDDPELKRGSFYFLFPWLKDLYLRILIDNWMLESCLNIQYIVRSGQILIHEQNYDMAEWLEREISLFLLSVGFENGLDPSRIIYCKNSHRKALYPVIQFDFLGFSFQPRRAIDARGNIHLAFSPSISTERKSEIRSAIRNWKLSYHSEQCLQRIALKINPQIRIWIDYYGRYNSSELRAVLKTINWKLAHLMQANLKRFHGKKRLAILRLSQIAKSDPDLFAHWSYGVVPTEFDDK